ncbi:MAG: hypothetical protein HY234_01005 [Acidobacteria bacterium]|nr:hypothetical protein [Acidobacteriota bacterium]MBI3661618.1 hypothetical protein [Acidobacteriota bacterium]
MSLKPLTAYVEVKAGFDLLFENLSHDCQPIQPFVGWQGGGGKFTVYWNPQLRFWSLLDSKNVEARYWCCFGTDDPTQHASVGIVCEVNPPKENFDRRTAGVLLRDDRGRIYLGHSGKIGGGRKGIGKSNFLAFYQGELETVRWPDDRTSELIVIGQVDGRQLPTQIAHFVHEVEQFKQDAVRNKGRLPLSKLPASFKAEFSGRRRSYKPKGTVLSECDHGLLISALAEELEKRNLKYGNDRLRDLFVVSVRGQLQILFEAKTDLGTASIYGGVGQLMLHGAAQSSVPKRILVVPGIPKPKTRAALKKLGIVVLTYEQNTDSFKFVKLDHVLQ